MTDPKELANDYLTLWQEQWSAMAADPQWQKLMAQNMAQMQSFFGKAGQSATAGGDDVSKNRPASAAAPSDGGSAVLDELRRRVAALEERVSALESRS